MPMAAAKCKEQFTNKRGKAILKNLDEVSGKGTSHN